MATVARLIPVRLIVLVLASVFRTVSQVRREVRYGKMAYRKGNDDFRSSYSDREYTFY